MYYGNLTVFSALDEARNREVMNISA